MNAMTKRLGGKIAVLLMVALLLTIMAPAFAADKVPSLSVTISSFTDSAGSININVGKAEGIKVGSRGIIMRDGQKIADYEVVQVNWGFSRIEVFGLAKGDQVRAGDSAPITTTPTVKKSSKSKTIWIVAALIAVAALLGGRGGGSGSSSISLDAVKTSQDNNGEGTSTVAITARINKSDGTPAPNGTPVTFTTTSGTLNVTQTTTNAGVAKATLTHTPTDAGESAVVTVKALGKTATITISFTSSLLLTASPTTIQVRDSGGSPTSSILTAKCEDARGNPVAGGIVKFSTSLGTVANDTVIADSNGIATTTFTSSSKGKATVTATWLTNNKATVLITVNAGPPYAITTSSAAGSVQCDGNSFTTVTATVKDVKGNTVTDGTVVDFSIIPDGTGGGNGTITPQAITTNGVATVSLFTRDSTGAVSKSGLATIKAEVKRASQPSSVPEPLSDIANQSTTVQFISINIGKILLSAEPTNIRGWDVVGNNTTIKAVVYNADNQPVPNGTAVFFSATHGTVHGTAAGGITMSTTTNGIATATLTSDASGVDGWDGLVDVTATSGDVLATVPGLVIFSGPPSPSHCTAVASQTTLPKTGGVSTITVTAKDLRDHPIADGVAITANTSKGTISPADANTLGGIAHFTLATSTDTENPTAVGDGLVTITISSGGSNPETGGGPVVLTVPFTVN